MNNSITGLVPDIIGSAAKTEELKTKLLKSIAALFDDMSLYGSSRPSAVSFAEALNLLVELSLRYGIGTDALAREMKMQAKASLVRGDGSENKAVLTFVDTVL